MGNARKNSSFSIKLNFIWLGILFSFFYWTLESVRDVIAFQKGTFLERFFVPDTITIWMRLLIVFIILLFSAYVQSLKYKARQQKSNLDDVLTSIKHIWISVGFGALYWVLESIREAEVLNLKNILSQIFLPGAQEFFIRILAVCILVLFSIYIKTLIDARKKAEKQLQDLKDKYLSRKQKEFDVIKETNETLHKKIETLESQKKELENALRQQRNSIDSVHHHLRINTQSILRLLEIKYSDIENKNILELFNEIKILLYTLSWIHSKQYKGKNRDEIKFKIYLEDLVKYLSSLNYIHALDLYMDKEMLLPLKQAAPIALLLSELVQLSFINAQTKNDIKIFIQHPENEFLIKIRHSDQQAWQGFDKKNEEYTWVNNIIKDTLSGSAWIVRNKFAEMNIVIPM